MNGAGTATLSSYNQLKEELEVLYLGILRPVEVCFWYTHQHLCDNRRQFLLSLEKRLAVVILLDCRQIMFDDSCQIRSLGSICAGLLDIVLAKIHEALKPVYPVLECFKIAIPGFTSCCQALGGCNSVIQCQNSINRKTSVSHFHWNNSMVCCLDTVKIGGSIKKTAHIIQLFDDFKVPVLAILEIGNSGSVGGKGGKLIAKDIVG